MPCVCAHVCVWVCLSGFVEVCRGLSGFVEVCRGLTSVGATLCLVCVRMYVCGCVCRGLSGFVGVCRGLSRFVEPGGHMIPAFEIVNCTLYLY